MTQEWSLIKAHTPHSVTKSDAGQLTNNKVASEQGPKRKCKEDDDYNGVRQKKKSRPTKYVSECRLSALIHGKTAGKVWLGTFPTKMQAARAYDVGRMFCSKRARGFNFPASEGILSILKHVILKLPLSDKIKAIKEVAKEYGETGGIDGCTRKYCFPGIKAVPMEFRIR